MLGFTSVTYSLATHAVMLVLVAEILQTASGIRQKCLLQVLRAAIEHTNEYGILITGNRAYAERLVAAPLPSSRPCSSPPADSSHHWRHQGLGFGICKGHAYLQAQGRLHSM